MTEEPYPPFWRWAVVTLKQLLRVEPTLAALPRPDVKQVLRLLADCARARNPRTALIDAVLAGRFPDSPALRLVIRGALQSQGIPVPRFVTRRSWGVQREVHTVLSPYREEDENAA